MKIRIYPGLAELKGIYKLVFKTPSIRMQLNCSSDEALKRIRERIGKKESVHSFLPPVVITEIEGGTFTASMRSEQLFGLSLRLQNSPELRAKIANGEQGAEVTARFSYTSTFRVRLFAITLVVATMMLIGHLLVLLVMFGGRYVTESLIIGPGWILISTLIFRVVLTDMKNAGDFEEVLLEWIHRLFPRDSENQPGRGAVNPLTGQAVGR